MGELSSEVIEVVADAPVENSLQLPAQQILEVGLRHVLVPGLGGRIGDVVHARLLHTSPQGMGELSSEVIEVVVDVRIPLENATAERIRTDGVAEIVIDGRPDYRRHAKASVLRGGLENSSDATTIPSVSGTSGLDVIVVRVAWREGYALAKCWCNHQGHHKCTDVQSHHHVVSCCVVSCSRLLLSFFLSCAITRCCVPVTQSSSLGD